MNTQGSDDAIHDLTPPARATEGGPHATLSAGFEPAMQRLSALNALRYTDPARALEELARAGDDWAHLPEAERCLLQASRAMQIASAHTVMGAHAKALPVFEAMKAALDHPALAGAQGELLQRLQRCETSGANARAVLAHALGDLAGAQRHYLRALDLTRALGQARNEAHVRVNLANTYEEAGLPAEALEQLRLALPLAEAEGMAELIGDLHHNMGNVLAAAGDGAAGLESNRRALAQYTQLALPQKQRYALVAIAERLLELGRFSEARAALAERERLPEDYRNLQYEAYAAYLDGRIAAAQGRTDDAQRAFERALGVSAETLADPVGQARARLELARLDMARGRLDDAEAQAQGALALLQSTAATRDQMQAHRLAYETARQRMDLAAALAHHEQFHAAYARMIDDESATRARMLAVRHDVDMLHADARRQRLENTRLAEALAEISARLEGRPAPTVAPHRAVTAADLQSLGLTPREAEVLYWVALGKTNEDVGHIVGASLSTVKKHLLRIYEKLGVENRTAAANVARQRGV